jgi:hypothetical protein
LLMVVLVGRGGGGVRIYMNVSIHISYISMYMYAPPPGR